MHKNNKKLMHSLRPQNEHTAWRTIIPLGVILLAMFVILPQFEQFKNAFSYARTADLRHLCIAGFFMISSVTASALTYIALTGGKLSFSRTLLVMWAGMFVNRLLPAGMAGMGLAARFLYRSGYTVGKSSVIALMNNVLGFFGHLLLILLGFIIFDAAIPRSPEISKNFIIGIILVIAVGIVTFVVLKKTDHLRSVNNFARESRVAFRAYRKKKSLVFYGYLASLLNTGSHVFMLTFVIQSFSLGIGIGAIIVILTGGVTFATLSPTPGGIGGSEAGITTVMAALGVPVTTAFAVAITYRLISYWLPLIPGSLAFALARRKHYV